MGNRAGSQDLIEWRCVDGCLFCGKQNNFFRCAAAGEKMRKGRNGSSIHSKIYAILAPGHKHETSRRFL